MSFEPLSWDSELFGFPIGRVPEPAALDDAVSAADADGVRCLYLLCPADEDHALQAALDAGFRPYDVRVELERALEGTEPGGEEVREANAGDEAGLSRIAAERFTGTRFFADPHFPREACRELYVAWLRRGLTTAPERRTLVAGDAEGFVTCRFDAASGTGTIELIGVADGAAGRGLGAALLAGAHRAFAGAGLRRASVVTQARNVPALRLYERHGYLTSATAVWLHRWR